MGTTDKKDVDEETIDTPSQFSEEQYLTERLADQIDWYDRKSIASQQWFKRLQVTQIVAAAAIPFLAGVLPSGGLLPKVVLGALGLLVAVAASVQTLYRFQEHWVEYRAVCETLRHERFLYLTRTAPYDQENAFHLLVQRVERLISQEHSRWIEEMHQQEIPATPVTVRSTTAPPAASTEDATES